MKSLRARILIPLLSLTGLVVCLSAWGLDQAMSTELIRSLDAKLTVMAQGVGSAIEIDIYGNVEFDPEDIGISELEGNRDDFFFSVHDSKGLVAATKNAPMEPLENERGPAQFRRMMHQENSVRTCSVWVDRIPEDQWDDDENDGPEEVTPPSDQPTVQSGEFLITVGTMTSPLDATIASFRRKMLIGATVLLALLLSISLFVVSRALRGVQRLSREADAIGPQSPNSRLREDGVAREVQHLVKGLNRAVDRLAAAHEREKRFSSDVAHELRTPLSAIRTHCEVALRRPRSNEELRESLESILKSCVRLGALVEKMLMLARYQRQSQLLTRRTTDLSLIAKDVSSLHQAEAMTKGVKLTLEADNEVIVQGDEELIREAISNLVHNAVRYTPSQGEVVVKTRNGSKSGIEVRDTGIGIDQDHQKKIFDRFYRVDESREHASGSFGLGLALAQEIAELHGTRIHVESTAGEGSRFEIDFATQQFD